MDYMAQPMALPLENLSKTIKKTHETPIKTKKASNAIAKQIPPTEPLSASSAKAWAVFCSQPPGSGEDSKGNK